MQLFLSLTFPQGAPDAPHAADYRHSATPSPQPSPMIADPQIFEPWSVRPTTLRPGADPLDVLFAPLDVARAFELHGANCGPASFAALVGRNICEIMDLFPNFPERPFTNIPRMHSALRKTGLNFRRDTIDFPSNGLVLLQVNGPWTAPKRIDYESAYHRHWVTVRWGHVYEVNLESWVPRQVWEEDYLPDLLNRHEGSTGWSVRAVFEIEDQALQNDPTTSPDPAQALSSMRGSPRRKRV